MKSGCERSPRGRNGSDKEHLSQLILDARFEEIAQLLGSPQANGALGASIEAGQNLISEAQAEIARLRRENEVNLKPVQQRRKALEEEYSRAAEAYLVAAADSVSFARVPVGDGDTVEISSSLTLRGSRTDRRSPCAAGSPGM